MLKFNLTQSLSTHFFDFPAQLKCRGIILGCNKLRCLNARSSKSPLCCQHGTQQQTTRARKLFSQWANWAFSSQRVRFFSPSGVRGGDDRRQNNYIMNLLHLKHRVSQFRELGILAMRKALRGIKWSFKRYRGKTFIVYTIKKTQFKSDLETQFLTHLFRLLYSIILHLDHKALAFDRRPPLSFSFSPPREKCVGTPLLVHSY